MLARLLGAEHAVDGEPPATVARSILNDEALAPRVRYHQPEAGHGLVPVDRALGPSPGLSLVNERLRQLIYPHEDVPASRADPGKHQVSTH